MGNQFTKSTVDREKLDPAVLAAELENKFNLYYTARKNNLDRKKKDLAALKNRAGLSNNNIPRVSSNAITALYNNVG